MSIQIEEKELNEIKLKDIRACSNAFYKCGHLGHFQRNYIYGHPGDVDNDTSTTIIGQMHHTSSENSPFTETVLKLILKELISTKAAKKIAKQSRNQGVV